MHLAILAKRGARADTNEGSTKVPAPTVALASTCAWADLARIRFLGIKVVQRRRALRHNDRTGDRGLELRGILGCTDEGDLAALRLVEVGGGMDGCVRTATKQLRAANSGKVFNAGGHDFLPGYVREVILFALGMNSLDQRGHVFQINAGVDAVTEIEHMAGTLAKTR